MKLTIEYSNNSLSNQKLDAIIVFIFEDSGLTGSGLSSLPAALKKNLNTSLKLKVFTGKKDNCQQLFSGHANIPQILAVGVGKKSEMYCTGIQVLNPKKINDKIKPADDFNLLWRRLIKKKQLYVSDIKPKRWFTVDNIENYKNLKKKFK